MVLYLDTTAISNQVKYYLTANRGNFLEMLYGFHRYALLADLPWLVFDKAFTKNSRIARVELNCERSLKLSEGEAGIVNVEGCGMHWYLS